MKKSINSKIALISALILSAFSFSSCVTLSNFLDYTDASGNPDFGKIASVSEAIVTGVENIEKAAEGVPPETEYAIGRSAAAVILENYNLYDNQDATEYLNKICKTLTINSEKPFLYKGYFVAILDSKEINAIATPGGHIFISKGLIDCTDSEDALAAVIAHELSHIQIGHSKQVIESERGLDVATSALSIVLAAGGNDFSVDDVKSLNDTSNSFIRTVMRNGFSQAQEYEADANAINLMVSAGYNPYALLDMLHAIENDNHHLSGGWDETHPAPKKRIKEAESFLKKNRFKQVDMSSRELRFAQFKLFL